jgi:hypothetical protein
MNAAPARVQYKLAVVAAALLALVAAVETGTAVSAGARVAPAADWEAAAAEVRAGLEPGDLVVFAPRWVDQIGRAHLGDVIPVEMAARADADRYARVWEVSIRGARADESRGARLLSESRHGRVRVALYEKPAVSVVYDFTSHADEARVTQTLGDGSSETPCYRDVGSGFRCAGSRVERRTLEIDYQPRRGILTPADGARTTHVAFAEAPLGATLVVYAGIHDYYSRKSADGRVDFRLFVDGRELLTASVGNGDGWRRFTVDTAALAGTRHQLRFDVSARDPAWRTFGFHAEARP